MKRTTSIILTGILAVGIVSCKKKGCTDSLASNYDSEAKKNDGSCEYDTLPEYSTPSTYIFTDGNGNSTVDFSGQQQRLDMLSEMVVYMKTGNTQGTQLSATQLKNMYANNGYTWTDANGLGMTGSTKQLENKTAGGDVITQNEVKAMMDSIEVMSNSATAGSNGIPGVVTSSTNSTRKYLQSGTGKEYAELIEKTMMCAVFYYNISIHYLGDDQMNVDNTTAVDPTNGKYYTTMEHHWDEAYGYFTSEIDYPTNGADRFFGEYADGRENLLQSATKISAAFRKGRAAISNKDLATRDIQIDIIRTEMEKVIAGTAIHYLNAALNNISDDALRNHTLSEAYGFISGLKFGNNPGISNTQINDILTLIGNDFYAVTVNDLTMARDQLSSIFGMNDIKTLL